MKHKFIRIIVVSIIIALNISCEKQQEFSEQPKHKGLTIKATADASSRTTFDGESSKWSIDDELNIYISGGGISAPQTKIFTITNAEQGIFTNDEVNITSGTEYQFHAIYPSSYGIDTPTKSATINIGATSQTQVGTSPNHIAPLDPLYGNCTSTPEEVSITMNHTAVAFKLNIENLTGNPLSIKKVIITAPTGVAIAGEHSINLETGSITPSSAAGATSNIIELSINEPATIANNASFTAWIASAPFSIAEGGSLLFTVIDSNNNEYDVIKSFVDGHTFSSGNIATTTLTINDAAKVTSNQNKEVTLDFSVAANLSPTTNMTEQVKDLLYHSGIYISRIHATSKCYYSSNDGGGLLLVEIKNNNDATLTLPQISGYKISSVTFNNAKTSGINATIELYNREKDKVKIFEPIEDDFTKTKGYSSQITQQEVAINNIVGIIDDTQYYIKFTKTTGHHHIKSMVVTYKRIR